jgi:hypothetical protein
MRTHPRVASLAVALVCTATAGVASAQASPRRGQVTIAVERVFGFHMLHTEIEGPGGDQEADLSSLGLMWMRSESAFHQPRAAIDFFLTDGLSLGGSIAFYSWGDDSDRNGFLLYPRVGYGIGLGDSVTFWPRGGITYFSEEAPGGNPEYTQVALSGEAMFVIWPRRDWGFLLGPTIDLGLTGEVGDADFRQQAFGVTFGLLGSL